MFSLAIGGRNATCGCEVTRMCQDPKRVFQNQSVLQLNRSVDIALMIWLMCNKHNSEECNTRVNFPFSGSFHYFFLFHFTFLYHTIPYRTLKKRRDKNAFHFHRRQGKNYEAHLFLAAVANSYRIRTAGSPSVIIGIRFPFRWYIRTLP
jgi:hypothetical protein